MPNWRRRRVLFAGTVLLAMLAGIFWAVYYYRHRFVRNDAQMVALLPHADTTIFYANLKILRKAGYLDTLIASQRRQEPEYQSFVTETHFNYERDIDALAGASDGTQLFFIVKGRFDWGRLRRYPPNHGGGCAGVICSAPTSKPDRWASFLEIQPNVMGLAVSGERSAALALSPRRDETTEQLPAGPVWVKVSHSVLRDPLKIPLALRIFAITLQSTDSVVLSVEPDPSGTAAFDIRLDAACRNGATAETASKQLEIQTKMLNLELSRENHKPDPSDLSGLLLGGTFQVVDKTVVGIWPVHKQLLDTLR